MTTRPSDPDYWYDPDEMAGLDAANALRFILQHYCGEDGMDTLDHPDGWNTQDAIDCIGEHLRAAVLAEREACAKIADEYVLNHVIATTIRARTAP